jgi:hypothetical protein
MGSSHYSKVFPATARPTGAAVSRDALRSSLKRLQESRARQAQAQMEARPEAEAEMEAEARP